MQADPTLDQSLTTVQRFDVAKFMSAEYGVTGECEGQLSGMAGGHTSCM